jgi:hypothetical protein
VLQQETLHNLSRQDRTVGKSSTPKAMLGVLRFNKPQNNNCAPKEDVSENGMFRQGRRVEQKS